MDMIGKVLNDRYEIEELIGSGGMARVYKAKCRQLNRYVAVKILREELKDDKEFVEKFKTEALAAASLTHPNIVSVFDSGEEDGIYYFVMEYVEGYTLKQYIARKGALQWREACNITLGICNAIEQAHKNNIVHRDIKPHNIMLNTDGVVKVTDFGIAKAVSSSTIVRGGNIIGSVHYFSPEQARGASSTFKSDIYSIGIVFYELLTGRVPFDANDPFNVAKMQVEQMPIEPKRFNESVPRSVNAVVMRALAKKPEERYNSVTEMIAAIKNAISIAGTYGDEAFEEFVEDFDNTTEVPVVIAEDKEDKKKDSTNNKKEDKASMLFGIVIGVVIVAAVLLGIFFATSNQEEPLKIDDFVGKVYENIKDDYDDKYIFVTDETYDEDFKEGEIVSQTPEAGERYTKNDLPITVELVINVPKGNKMEDFVGEDAESVKYLLEKQGYNVEIREKTSDDVDEGLVIRTTPTKGTLIEKGDRIVLFTSIGPEEDETKPEPDDKNKPNEDDQSETEPSHSETNEPQAPSTTDQPSTKPTTPSEVTKPTTPDNPYEGL